MKRPTLDAFTTAYLTAMLFTEHDPPMQGQFQEHGTWTCARIAGPALRKAVADCAAFQIAFWDDISEDVEHAGRDLWFTRNGHGCGFWDGDWPENIGEKLTAAAEVMGEVSVYRSHGRIYFD